MPSTVVERFGSLSATGIAKETTFGSAVTATTFLPMTGNQLELDPGLFSPKVMFGQRDVNTFPLYGQYKNAGSISGPLFPTNGMMLLAGAIGADAAAGSGVTGSSPTTANTLNGSTSAGATTVTLTSATGYTVGTYIQVDVNGSGPTTTAEVRKITIVSTNTLTLDTALTYAHTTGAATAKVVAPFVHSITQATSLPSFTVEKNIGGTESLIFAGSKVGKYGLQVQNGNSEVSMSADLVAKSSAVQATPTAIAVTDESPWVFAEATASIWGTAATQVTSMDFSIENGLKETYTFNSSHNLQFLSPVTLAVTCKLDLVFHNLNDADWGYWTRMQAPDEGALSLTLTHPASAGAASITLARARIKSYGDAVKMDDIIMTSLNFDAYLKFSTLTTIGATVSNTQWLPY